jgi:predicted nicotinamide N-methyase
MDIRENLGTSGLNGNGRDWLPAGLERVGPLRRDEVLLPGTDLRLEIICPADFDRLLDAAAGDPEQNLPYWAELWPSGIALAAAIEREPAELTGERVLELGCGLGVTAIAALRAGADLLATDYAPEALALCALNARATAGQEPGLLQVNWRNPAPEFWQAVGERYPVVLAADVLYEARDVAPLLSLTERLVAPRGELWLAEPGRKHAKAFVKVMGERGWSDRADACAGPWPDPEDNRRDVAVTIHRFTRVA